MTGSSAICYVFDENILNNSLSTSKSCLKEYFFRNEIFPNDCCTALKKEVETAIYKVTSKLLLPLTICLLMIVCQFMVKSNFHKNINAGWLV